MVSSRQTSPRRPAAGLQAAQRHAAARAQDPAWGTPDLRRRLERVLTETLQGLKTHRPALRRLVNDLAGARSPSDRAATLAARLRDDGTRLMAAALEGSDIETPRDLQPHVPRLLWLYEVGIVLFWLNDRSPGQARTNRLLAKSLPLLVSALRASSAPTLLPLRLSIVDLVKGL